tara:strand:+ start:480 stop:779 length:300 start_codon:yes stop_codon:yes gene_type:complete
MHLYWTSKLPIHGLRHFVCVKVIKDEGMVNVLLVSVIDIEVNLIVSKNELENSGLWNLGWMELNKSKSITEDYIVFKKRKNFSKPTKVFLDDSSPFNLS